MTVSVVNVKLFATEFLTKMLPFIHTVKRSSDWMAHVEGNTKIWEAGKSEIEAIGRLVITLQADIRRLAWNRSLKRSGPVVFVTYPSVIAALQHYTDEEKFAMVDWNKPENKKALKATAEYAYNL